MRLLLGVLAAGFLSGCATEIMSEKECLAGDWYAAGLEDGREGRLERTFDERAARCSEFGAAADHARYFAGRDEGLTTFCTDRAGYNFGAAGSSYRGVCAPETERDFLSGYVAGWRIHRAEKARERAEAAYDDALSLVENYRENIRHARRKERDEEASKAEIAKALKAMANAREQLPYAERNADALLYELGRADEALAQTYETAAAFRQTDRFAFIRDTLLEAHAFARTEEAIDFCTNKSEPDDAFIRPKCELLPGAALNDIRTGAVCAVGPMQALWIRGGPGGGPFPEAATIAIFGTFPADESGRAAREPSGLFAALFDDQGDFLGVACPEVLPSP